MEIWYLKISRWVK